MTRKAVCFAALLLLGTALARAGDMPAARGEGKPAAEIPKSEQSVTQHSLVIEGTPR